MLNLPHEKIHFYRAHRGIPWDQRFLDLLDMYNDGRIILHKVGEKPKGKFYDLGFGTNRLDKPDESAEYAKVVNWDKVDYNKLLDHVNFEKTICWGGRHSRDGVLDFIKPPREMLDRYSDFNFINVGQPLGEDCLKKSEFNLHDTAWIIKKSYKYIGVDSGTTHYAMTIKDSRDIIFNNKLLTHSFYENFILKKNVTVLV